MKFLVTGASGYLGSRFVALAMREGFEVVVATRRTVRAGLPGVETVPFDLATPENSELHLTAIQAIVHFAAIISEDSQPAGVPEDLNVSGTRHLLRAARQCGVGRFIFVSSQSAAADSPTRYGRSKWSIEQLLDGPGEISVRPGMVTGGPPRGLYGVLLRLVRRYPVLPVVRSDAPIYPIHVDDLCRAILALIKAAERPSGVIRVAPDESIPFGRYLHLLGWERLGRRVRLLPIPSVLVVALARFAGLLPGMPAGARERIMGLVALPTLPEAVGPHPALAGISLRPAAEFLGAEGRRRRLLLEGSVLLQYVLRRNPGPALLRRYARAVEVAGGGAPLGLQGWWRRLPGLLRFREPRPHDPVNPLRRRVLLATRIAEMTPEGALRFHRYRRLPVFATAFAMMGIVLLESLPLLFRALRSRMRRDRLTSNTSRGI